MEKESTSLSLPTKEKHTCRKLDLRKCEYFLDFIFNSGILQDVVYGGTNIKFGNGETQKIAHAILTKYSHAITFYEQMCVESGYKTLSSSTLLRILKAVKPSLRKSLSGLDDVQASAMNAFDFLCDNGKKS